MKKPRELYLNITLATCAALIIALWLGTLLDPATYDGVKLSRHDPATFNQGWERLTAGGDLTPVTFPLETPVEAYEAVVLVNTIPWIIYQDFTLLFRSNHQQVTVTVGGEIVYTYGDLNSHPFIKTAPGHWNMIPLPTYAGGQRVQVTLTSAYPHFSSRVSEFLIGGHAQCLGYIVSGIDESIVLSIAILFLGLFYLLSYLLIKGSLRFNARALLFWSLFTLLAGVWALGETQVDQFMLANPYVMWLATNMALFLLPLPIYFYTLTNVTDKKFEKIIRPLIALNIGAVIICFLLQLLGIYDLWETKLVAQCLIIICIILFLWNGLAAAVDITSPWQRARILAIILVAAVTFSMAIFLYDDLSILVGNALRVSVIIIALLWGGISLRWVMQEAVEARELRVEIKKKQLSIMTSQIKPHFIYNTLGAIHGQIATAPKLAEEMVYSFSKYLRANIDSISDLSLIPFEQELEHIRTYARIEELRFIGRVKVAYDIAAEDFEVPPLTIQPLVENAIKHGICKKREGGTVWVRTWEEAAQWVIQVKDDGVGFTPDDPPAALASSSGIINIRFRLETMIGGTVQITSRPGEGTTATVKIPLDR